MKKRLSRQILYLLIGIAVCVAGVLFEGGISTATSSTSTLAFQTAISSSPPGVGFTKENGGWWNNNDFPRMLGDVNKDGKADIVGFGNSHTLVSLGNGDGTFQTAIISSPPGAGFTKEDGGWINNNDFPRMLGDVNKDGKADIVGFGNLHTLVSLGNGDGTFQTAISSSPPGAGFTKLNGRWINNHDFPRMLGDVNGDGKADIVGFGGSHTLVSLGNGNGTFQTAISSSPPGAGFTKENGGWTNNNEFPRMLGDVNKDGKADIVGFGNLHTLVSLGNGNGTFQNAISSSPPGAGFTKENGGWTNNNEFPRMLGDVNGDGKADIVGFGNSHTLVSLGNGDGTFQNAISSSPPGAGFTKENGGWTNNNEFPRMLGDVNGDGKADIVGFGGSHVLISVAAASPPGLMATNDNLTKLINKDWDNQKFDVDGANGAQCWDLVAKATGIDSKSPYWPTSNWRRGINVISNGTVGVGTAIATFKGSKNSYSGHTAIFAGYDTVNEVSGFWAWSLNFPTGSGVRNHFIPINGPSGDNNNANQYYLIQL